MHRNARTQHLPSTSPNGASNWNLEIWSGLLLILHLKMCIQFFRRQRFDSCKKTCHEILATVESVGTWASWLCMIAHTPHWRSTRFCLRRLHKWHIITSIMLILRIPSVERCTTMRQKTETEQEARFTSSAKCKAKRFIYTNWQWQAVWVVPNTVHFFGGVFFSLFLLQKWCNFLLL